MRCGAGWSDVCVVNLSSRGVGLQGANPPKPGSYVELRRGSNMLIVGRVAWGSGQRFGIRTQDPLSIDSVINDGDSSEVGPNVDAERRAAPRDPLRAEWSRIGGRKMQFAAVIAAGLCATVVLVEMIASAFARPMQLVGLTLGN